MVDYAMMGSVPTDETYTVAGFVAGHRWVPPAREWPLRMPSSVVTVSDCLADFEPPDQDPLTAPWHVSLDDARGAAGGTTAQPLAMSVPSSAAGDLASLIELWIGDFAHPILINLDRPTPPPTGNVLGFEVLGFDSGRFHTWLCYGLIDNATQELAIYPNEHGLIATHADAMRLTELANQYRGTTDGTPEDVTWFPALITAYQPPATEAVRPDVHHDGVDRRVDQNSSRRPGER